MLKGQEYINIVKDIVASVEATQSQTIEMAAKVVADTLVGGGKLYVFGTGHSHMMAEELFYRAGGLVRVQPMLEEAFMLHAGAVKSTSIERLPGYAQILFDDYGIARGDAIIIASNSGRNGVAIELAQLCQSSGVTVIALTNLKQSQSAKSRHASGKNLYECADIVLDNMGVPGDASVEIEGLSRFVGATSTAIGAMILNAVAVEAAAIIAAGGKQAEIYSSSNIDGGESINQQYIKKYRGVIRGL